MGRFGVGFTKKVVQVPCLFFLITFLITGFFGCGSNKAVTSGNFPVPGSVTLSPTPAMSLEVGTNQPFSATVTLPNRSTSTQPVFFQSSNTGVVTVASNGLACAGSWDNLTNPQICTPGPTGTSNVVATAQNVSSPATTVYVHQHIDQVVINPVTPPNSPPPGACSSVGQTAIYEARAFSRGVDITSTVGPFTFQANNATVAKLSNTASVLANFINGVSQNQVQVAASTPGTTSIFATVGTAVSVPVAFNTCLVQRIDLAVTQATATSRTITPTVIDQAGMTITGVPLTWSSSQSASVSVSTSGVANLTTGGGAATVIASCTPPTCNIGGGGAPSQPIYPTSAVQVIPGAASTAPSETVYVSSTGCGTTDNCVSTIFPVTTPANTVGTPAVLPATPNSLVIDPAGTNVFLGTNSGLRGSKGLVVLNASNNTANQFTSAPGKVLAVSPDAKKVVISDTSPQDGPNQVFVFDTSTNTPLAFAIMGATAADFSPDSMKAFIVAGSNLYVYSTVDALQTVPLVAPANDVSFFPEGAFGYLAGGDSNGVDVRWTCSPKGSPGPLPQPITPPTFIKALSDARHFVAVAPPLVDVITVQATPQGCSPSVTNSVASFDLGHGNFTATQLIVSQDGTTAYIISSNFNSVLVFNVAGETSTSIGLVGNAIPLRASLSPDGSMLYVGTSDGTLHVIQTAIDADIQQISFPQGLCEDTAGNPFPGLTCNPDLVTVKP